VSPLWNSLLFSSSPEDNEFAAEVVPEEDGGGDEDLDEAVVEAEDGDANPHPELRPEKAEKPDHAEDEERADGASLPAILRLRENEEERENVVDDETGDEAADRGEVDAKREASEQELLRGDERREVNEEGEAADDGVAEEFADERRERRRATRFYAAVRGGVLKPHRCVRAQARALPVASAAPMAQDALLSISVVIC